MTPTVELRPTEPADRPYVETILDANGLPVADLDEAIDDLYIAEGPSGRVGVGGLEQYGENALLRSVAVEESVRGKGYGTTICERLLDRARADGVTRVYLLTTTAAEFFADLGFDETDRETVPESIQHTTEFSDLCPSTATCMKRDLD